MQYQFSYYLAAYIKYHLQIALLVIVLIIVLIFAIFMIMKSLKPAPVRISEEVSQIQMKADTPDSKLAQTEPHVIPESSHPLTVTGKKYTIQAAEYADEEAAERFINALKKQGYVVNVDTIYRDKEKKKAYFKINVGAYNTLSDAKKFNEVFRKRTNIKDSFIKELKR